MKFILNLKMNTTKEILKIKLLYKEKKIYQKKYHGYKR